VPLHTYILDEKVSTTALTNIKVVAILEPIAQPACGAWKRQPDQGAQADFFLDLIHTGDYTGYTAL
jgi:hypothetical protein